MASNVQDLRQKPPESEKITINLGYVDLGHVDLMVKDGFYSNRTDFIRTAIRNQLERHADVVKQSTAKAWTSVCGITPARISKRRGKPARCCILATGYAELPADRSIEFGHLSKPYTSKELAAALEKVFH
jgi:Arc/MetJ-type ribon-helix-helix transcriptional regulator